MMFCRQTVKTLLNKGTVGLKICFPTETLQGMDGMAYGDFGSTPGFVIVDTGTGSVEEIANGDPHHAHGMCRPFNALGERRVDAIVVSGIGMGALMKPQADGIVVYRAVEGTVRENVEPLHNRSLPQFQPEHTCAGHSGGGCAH